MTLFEMIFETAMSNEKHSTYTCFYLIKRGVIHLEGWPHLWNSWK